ncbi:phosphotransferase family protein [Phenylobacterium sp.]|uniref:phosphotransferase family protein n=1 Tax=Phenylobacterium sp. TaxID=1871053 RepID=UPI002E378527|nr:phosphotransferase family protein [Phenylobacterium sp.]HEX2560870.1 phosphotransferase family protein [Phenylobacterium sp.]
MSHPLEPRLAAYLAGKMPDTSDVAVDQLSRIAGGASRETYRFRLTWREDGETRERRLILRRDPPASLIETERRIEFEAYRAFRNSAVPVPEMLYLEEESDALDHPFFIAEEISGFQAGPGTLWTEPYLACHAELGRRKWTILGEIAKADPQALGLTTVLPPATPEDSWRRELDHWEGVLDDDETEPLPIVRAAIRWLRAHPPPPPPRLSVVHGDYRTGNFLYDTEGGVHGVLDWEMCHLGDPLEDLGWSFNPVWSFGRGLVGGLLPRDEAVAAWESASGLKADPDALHWWELMGCVKGQAIWISSGKAWIDGGNREPIMVYPPWALQNAQDRAMLKVMGRL